jgi:hypothetical protein
VKLRVLAAAALAVALAACTSTTAPAIGAGFFEPTAVAVFRGVTVKTGYMPGHPVYPYWPYTAVANAAGNDLTILDGVDDTIVQSSAPLHAVVYPVPGRPIHLVSADLGDTKPDLLAVVTAGDLPWLGGSQIEVIRTWAPEGGVAVSCRTTDPATCEPATVDVGADVLALKALPFDPAGAGTGAVQLVAALAGERVAVITFHRSKAGDGTAIDVAGTQVVVSPALGFQPLDLAVLPADPTRGTPTRVFAASEEPLPDGTGTLGVAEISIVGTPAFVPPGLNALAPTRLVAAVHLAEADMLRSLSSPAASALDATAFVDATTTTARPVVDRVYAVLHESGCGLQKPINCGLVALDPGTRTLLPDPTPVGSMQATYLAPVPVTGSLAVGLSGPPAFPPSAAEPQFAGTYMRIAGNVAPRQTTATAGVAQADGSMSYVDLARWGLVSQQVVRANVKAAVTSVHPTGVGGTQWLLLQGVPSHVDTAALAASVGLTPGYTPSDHWAVVREGLLPQLAGQRAEAGKDVIGPWLALQQTSADGVFAAVRLWDPTLGVRIGDTVVIDPVGLGTCLEFEATITDVVPPDATRPGGFVRLKPRVPPPDSPPITPAAQEMWNQCVGEISDSNPAGPPFYAVSFRAAGYLLLRGPGAAAIPVGRPVVGVPFSVAWQDETALAAACLLPPSRPWDPATLPGCVDAACRDGCMTLLSARAARRLTYVNEAPADATGPAIEFTLALEIQTAPVPRDLVLNIDTADGWAPFRAGPSIGSPVAPRQVVPFDRSPWQGVAGIRYLVPLVGGVVVDSTPTLPNGSTTTIH